VGRRRGWLHRSRVERRLAESRYGPRSREDDGSQNCPVHLSYPPLPPNDADPIRRVQTKIPLNEYRTSGVSSVMARYMIVWLLAVYSYAQDPQAAARALIPPGTKYSDALLDSVGQEADAAIARIPRATTKSEVENAREPLRKRLEHSLGLEHLTGFSVVKPIVTGSLERTGYRIEKIVFQTLPGLSVPAHLYLPADLHDRAPAVLLYPGHSWKEEGKSHRDAQIFSANMARMGLVVFVFDPIGQGERGPADEDLKIPQMLLVGLSQPGIAEYEIRCALDYLSSRPEVDPHRIGMTGADGGGFMTWITVALDDRIAAAAIADDTEDFGDLIHRMRQTDWDQASDQRELIPGVLQYANNHELLAMFAPHPLLVMSNSQQFGQNASVRSIFDYGSDIYGRFAANGKIQLLIDSDDGPGYQHQKRQAAYRFFLTALMGQDPQPLDENPGEAFPSSDSPDLRCLPPGAATSAGSAIMNVVRWIANRLPVAGADILVKDLVPPWPPPVRYGWSLGEPGVWRYVYSTQHGGYSIPWLFMLKEGEKGMVIALDDRGKEALVDDPVVLEAEKRGYAVGAIDMRGTGELAGHPGWLFAVNLLLGDNVEWKQAWDVLILLDEWHEFLTNHFTALYANGPVASLAASYVMSMRQGPAPEWLVMRNGFTSFRELLNHPEIPDWSILPGALSSVDLMGPFSASRTNDVAMWIVDPLDPVLAKTTVPAKVKITSMDEFLSSGW